MTAVVMPQAGQDLKTATLVEWKKKENEPVTRGEVIAVVESEKATFEVEAEASGVLVRVLVREGDEGEVLAPIAYIAAAGEGAPSAPAPYTASVAPASAAPTIASPRPPGASGGSAERLRASPLARRVARERAVRLEGVRGTGPGGRILKSDVLRAAEQVRPARVPDGQAAAERRPFSRMRRVVARRMARSTREVPHFTLFCDVDVEAMLDAREVLNRSASRHITITDQVVHAVSRVLLRFPNLNTHVDAEGVTRMPEVNVGVATAVEDGLLVPVIGNAARKTLDEISTELKEKAGRARRGVVDPVPAGTFTVTSLGMYGIPRFLPIINQPECAILGVGAVGTRAVVRGGRIEARAQMTLSLAVDHRATDGEEAARFLMELKEHLESGPERTGHQGG